MNCASTLRQAQGERIYFRTALGGLGVLSTVFEDKGDCLPKITPGFFLGRALTVGAGDFGTICYIPVVVFLYDGSEFIPHIRLPQSLLSLALPFSRSSLGKILSGHSGHVE